MSFISKLEVKHDKKQRWVLTSPLVYIASSIGSIAVPEGFVTDFASIPRVLLSIIGRPTGKLSEPSVLHDFLYSGGFHYPLSRSAADDLFLEAMKANGVSRIKRYVVWSGARIGGWAVYKGDN